MLANIDGKLEVGDAGCVTLWHDQGVALAVLPHGSQLEGEDIVLPNGSRIRLGAEFVGHGGWFEAQDLPELDVPMQCNENTVVLISGVE